MKPTAIIQKLKEDFVEYRIITFNTSAVYVVTIGDTAVMERDEAWVIDRKVYKGRNLRKLFKLFRKDKRYTNYYDKESWYTHDEWLEFLNNIAVHQSSVMGNTFDEETYNQWRFIIDVPRVERKHKGTKEDDNIPF